MYLQPPSILLCILQNPNFSAGASWISLLIYGPAALFSFIELSTNLIIATPVLRYWGYSYQYAPNMIPYLIELAWAFGIVVLSLFLCIWYYFHVPGLQQKNQTKYIVVGFSVAIIGEFVSEAVLPFFHIVIPETETIFFIFFSGMVSYTILKFELFVVNPTTAADNIVSTMTDALILLDHSNTIMSVNEETVKIVGYPQENLVGRPFEHYLLTCQIAMQFFQKLPVMERSKMLRPYFVHRMAYPFRLAFPGQ